MTDDEANRFGARAARYAAVGAQAGGLAARMLSGRLFGDASPIRGNSRWRSAGSRGR